MDWGKHLRGLQQAQESGFRVDALDEEPELYDDLVEVWDLFNILNASRPNTGMGITSLPISEIVALLDLYGITDYERRVEIFELLHFMDSILVKKIRSKEQTRRGNTAS